MLQNPKWDEGLLDLTKPSLKALAHILRHKELWPKGFEWDYRSCNDCAMGLAYQIWNEVSAPRCRNMADVFHIPDREASHIFTRLGGIWMYWNNQVTPEMVADQIDKHLASA